MALILERTCSLPRMNGCPQPGHPARAGRVGKQIDMLVPIVQHAVQVAFFRRVVVVLAVQN